MKKKTKRTTKALEPKAQLRRRLRGYSTDRLLKQYYAAASGVARTQGLAAEPFWQQRFDVIGGILEQRGTFDSIGRRRG